MNTTDMKKDQRKQETPTGGLRRLAAATLAGAGLLAAGTASAISITQNSDGATLANQILGPGLSLAGTPTVTGDPRQFGLFTGGAGEVGIDQGIVLSTGDVSNIPGANAVQTPVSPCSPETLGCGSISDFDQLSGQLGGAGDADLATLAGANTFDAAVLQFDFSVASQTDVFIDFVFASEEYINFVNSQFNDVFAFFVDGTNIALVPGTPDPVTVNNINPLTHNTYYVNNVPNSDGYGVAGRAIRFDGLTTVLTGKALGLPAGTHTMKIAIADTSDAFLDSGVFIRAASFTNMPPPAPAPAPASLWLLGAGLMGLAARGRRGA